MNKYFKYIFTLLFICFIVPQIALASWWNPLSWFHNQNNSSTSKIEIPATIAVGSGDQANTIDQLNKTIVQLQQQLKDYRCPECTAKTIIKEVPVATACNCPVCQPSSTPTVLTPTPLTAICIIDPNPTTQGKLTTFTIRAHGGTGVYYYTYLGNPYIKLPSCSGTTSDLTCTTCFGGGGLCPSAYNENTGTFMSNRGKIVVQVSDSGGQIKNITCPELIVE